MRWPPSKGKAGNWAQKLSNARRFISQHYTIGDAPVSEEDRGKPQTIFTQAGLGNNRTHAVMALAGGFAAASYDKEAGGSTDLHGIRKKGIDAMVNAWDGGTSVSDAIAAGWKAEKSATSNLPAMAKAYEVEARRYLSSEEIPPDVRRVMGQFHGVDANQARAIWARTEGLSKKEAEKYLLKQEASPWYERIKDFVWLYRVPIGIGAAIVILTRRG